MRYYFAESKRSNTKHNVSGTDEDDVEIVITSELGSSVKTMLDIAHFKFGRIIGRKIAGVKRSDEKSKD